MASNGNEFLPNYVEHLVPLEETKQVLPKKLGVVGLGFFLTIALFCLVLFSDLQFLGGLILIFIFGIGALMWYLWRFVAVEFEYTILQGEMSFDVIYGRRSRKPLYSAPIRNMEKISSPASPSHAADLAAADKTVFAASRMTNPNTRYALVREENGSRTLLYFEITEKAEKSLRFYNAKAFFGNA